MSTDSFGCERTDLGLHINVTLVHGDATPTSFQSYSWEQVARRAIEWNDRRERDGLSPVVAVYCAASSDRDEDCFIRNRKLTCHTLSDLASEVLNDPLDD